MSKKTLSNAGLFKCYIDGVYYKTAKNYSKDLEGHMINGDWEKAMISNTSENRKYIYNYRCMNGKFIPNGAPNILRKEVIIPIFRSTIIKNMVRRFELSKNIGVNE
jgi:hypothetical protein